MDGLAALAPANKAQAVVIDMVACSAAVFDARHQNMIRDSDAIAEACLEDLTPASLAHIDRLIEQLRTDLAFLRRHKPEG